MRDLRCCYGNTYGRKPHCLYGGNSYCGGNSEKRGIKTDNGFEIKANLTDFEDPMKYSVRQNDDGSIDIVIKNVRFYEEK